MAQENVLLTGTFEAGEDLSEKRYHIVRLDSGKLKVATSGSHVNLGVLTDFITGKDGDKNCTVVLAGTTKVSALSDGVNEGSYVNGSTGGQAEATTTDQEEVLGVALESAGTQNDLVEVLITHGRYAGA